MDDASLNDPDHPSVKELKRAGKQLRKEVPRSSARDWVPATSREPLRTLDATDQGRVPILVQERHRRMCLSPFNYLRGSAAMMAEDLGALPVSNINVQLCGDAHLNNFGLMGTPERRLVLDINDFDETAQGSFEWDLLRLGSSISLIGSQIGLDAVSQKQAVSLAVRSYRETMFELSALGELELWFHFTDAEDLIRYVRDERLLGDKHIRQLRKRADKIRSKNAQKRAWQKTEFDPSGRRQLITNDRNIIRFAKLGIDEADGINWAKQVIDSYQETLTFERQALMSRYQLIDAVYKIGGIGSMGLRRVLVLLRGIHERDLLMLDLKEATPSVLSAVLPQSASQFGSHGERVVQGQRILQAAGDMLLGYAPEKVAGFDWYVRSHGDWDAGLNTTSPSFSQLKLQALVCGATLARGHARSGNRYAINGYLGNSDIFDQSIANFAYRYSLLTHEDHAQLMREQPSK